MNASSILNSLSQRAPASVRQLSTSEMQAIDGGGIACPTPSCWIRTTQAPTSGALNGKGNSAMTEEIEMVIERLERG